jgi:hypothetical protein
MAVLPAGHQGFMTDSKYQTPEGSWTHHTLHCVVGCFRAKHCVCTSHALPEACHSERRQLPLSLAKVGKKNCCDQLVVPTDATTVVLLLPCLLLLLCNCLLTVLQGNEARRAELADMLTAMERRTANLQ